MFLNHFSDMFFGKQLMLQSKERNLAKVLVGSLLAYVRSLSNTPELWRHHMFRDAIPIIQTNMYCTEVVHASTLNISSFSFAFCSHESPFLDAWTAPTSHVEVSC